MTRSCALVGLPAQRILRSHPPTCMHILRLEIGLVEGVWWGDSQFMARVEFVGLRWLVHFE